MEAESIHYKGVMVSSTFTDLKEHRAALIRAIDGQEFKSVVMENDSAKPAIDVLDSSLEMVHKASAYVRVISHKYGQVPDDSERNPNQLSLTELEFNEAQHLKRPVLIFIMGEDHPIKKSDIESDPEKSQKLEAFRENVKRLNPDSSVHRVYATFNNLHEFEVAATQSIADLRRYLDEQAESATTYPKDATLTPDTTETEPNPIPTPRAFHAEPPYIGSHEFVGRKAQLDILNDWAAPADSHPVLLFEAIGGTGKSMLTWEWVTKHATDVRKDWAGRFWYSFYEKGAIMADFCRRALAYITGQPLEDFQKKKTAELSELLLQHLKAQPWLIVFDGLERVLVAYHRFDAAQITDEEAGAATDQIAHRDPCAAIRPEDDELLRALAGATPSKLLLTSRLIPRVLLNPAHQPIPGVLRERLLGLRPADAEALLRACDVSGASQAIRNYLQSHCDCHPLVIGVLAGLINDYLPDRGNFDAWVTDTDYNDQLNLADLDLIQKRNHILNAALTALPEKSRQLLSTLALLSEAVDYPLLLALNPHLPQGPENGGKEEYEQALKDRLGSPEFLAALQKLQETVRDLERRGLLQYDPHSKRYDLHPVVRGISAGGLRQEETERYGQRVVDHFSQRAHRPYEEAESLEDVRNGLHVVRALIWMGRQKRAFNTYSGDLSNALLFNLEAHAETLSLLHPFFPQGWATLPSGLDAISGANLANYAGIALYYTGEYREAFAAYGATLLGCLQRESWVIARSRLSNIAEVLADENRLAQEERCHLLALDVAAQLDAKESLFIARLSRFQQLARIGLWKDAEAMWRLLDPMGRDWSRAAYRPGRAEYYYTLFCFWRGDVTEEHLAHAERLAKEGNNRIVIRWLHGLRGERQLEQGRYQLAADSLHEAVRMAREVGQTDAQAMQAEVQLALAGLHLGQLTDPRHDAEQLAEAKQPFHRGLADLWLAIGDHEQAKKHALTAYTWAWADGEPYVHRYELNKARALLEKLGVAIPDLPSYDPAKDEKLPWEDEVTAAIDKLRRKRGRAGR